MGGGDRGCIAERDHNFGILFSFVAKDCEHLLLVQGCCDSTGFDGRRSRVGGCDDCVGLEAGRWCGWFGAGLLCSHWFGCV